MPDSTAALNGAFDITIASPTPSGLALVTLRHGRDVLKFDRFNVMKESSRREFLEGARENCPGIDDEAFRQSIDEFKQMAAEIAGSNVRAKEPGVPESPDVAKLLRDMPEQARKRAQAMRDDPNIVRMVIEDIARLGIVGEHELTMTVYLIGTSRLLERPLACIVQGPTCSGKSVIVSKVAELFPPESVIKATTMTPQSLYHLPPGSLVHKFVVAGERSRLENDDTVEAKRALREMISEHRLSKLISVQGGDRWEGKLIEQEGPISFVETTTLTKIFEEDANRCILLQTDERAQQTRRAMIANAKNYIAGGSISEPQRKAIVEAHYALQRMIQPMNIVIPFAERLAELLPDERCEARRAITQLLSTVEVLALLHQRQRERDGEGRLIATAKDYSLARHLLKTPLGRTLGQRVSDAAIRFHEKLTHWFEKVSFTTQEAKRRSNVSESAVRGYLKELRDAGCVEVVEENKGPKPATHRLTETQPEKTEPTSLPSVEELFPNIPDADMRTT